MRPHFKNTCEMLDERYDCIDDISFGSVHKKNMPYNIMFLVYSLYNVSVCYKATFNMKKKYNKTVYLYRE